MIGSGFHFFGPVILVGRQGEHRRIAYCNVFLLTIWLSFILGGGSSGVYWMLSGRFWAALPLIGIMWAMGLVGWGILKGFGCPFDQLIPLEGAKS